MDFAHSPRTVEMRSRLAAFMDANIHPADAEWHAIADSGRYPLELVEGLKEKAKAEGLWNLFLPGLRDDEPGTRLTNLEYAPLAEIMGRVPWSSEVFNCNAPDTGNMEILHLFATPEQRRDWLVPLLDGRDPLGVSITEPDVASSDPTNLRTTIRRDGDHYVINGRKWFTTGATHPNCKFAHRHGRNRRGSRRQPPCAAFLRDRAADTPGFQRRARHRRSCIITRRTGIARSCSGTCACPSTNLLGEEGRRLRASPRRGSGRVASTIACAPSASANWRWS